MSRRMATRSTFRWSRANLAMTVPWNGSMKHVRNTKSPTSVTCGLVEAGVTMGTPAGWQTRAPARLRVLATSPTTAITRSWLTSFVTAAAASSGLPASSSTITLTGLPSTPPAALTSSTARSMPFRAEMPNVAVEPVSEPYSPMTRGLPVAALGLDFASPGWLPFRAQPATARRAARQRRYREFGGCMGDELLRSGHPGSLPRGTKQG